MRKWTIVVAACAAFGAPLQAATEPAEPATPAPDACRQEVSRFEQAIGFIRQSQGNAAAEALKEKLLPAKLESEILLKDGYCGLARHIRQKKLHR